MIDLDMVKQDFLYHLGLEWKADQLNERIKQFSDVRYVMLGGKPTRMKALAHQFALAMESNGMKYHAEEIEEVSQAGRYVMYKIGPVLTVSHGMGRPSLSILLEELAKLLYYAKKDNKNGLEQAISFLRLGTSGGIGVPPGSIIVSTAAVMHDLTPHLVKYALDRKVVYATDFDKGLRQEILDYSNKIKQLPPLISGKTMTADDFYLGQGRLDGYFRSDLDEKSRQDFFTKAHELGIRNFEMEAAELAAFSNRPGSPLNMRAATMCVTLLDRLQGDQVACTADELKSWEQGLLKFAVDFVCDALA
ncbi:MAG: uridine phosphorylase [Oligoflexales bacterium]|nr:uridine phosphorylase [Oligoflexales bacterium]